MVHALTGVKPILRGAAKLKDIYQKTLHSLEKIPEDSAYRRHTEAIICYRLSIVQESESNADIENAINCGTLEMLVKQATAEYELSRQMYAWKVWEPLMRKPHPEQWKWPPLVK